MVITTSALRPLLANGYHLMFFWTGNTGIHRRSPPLLEIILRASLATSFSQGIPISPRENALISLGKMEIPWKNEVAKLALIGKRKKNYFHKMSTRNSATSLGYYMLSALVLLYLICMNLLVLLTGMMSIRW